MDPVSAALELVRITAVRLAPSRAPDAPGSSCHAAAFVLVTAGRHWIDIDGLPGGFPVRAGDFLLLPSGNQYRIADSVAGNHAPSSGHDTASDVGAPDPNGGSATSLITGVFELDGVLSRRLTAMLPKVIHLVGANTPESEWIRNTLQFVAEERRRPRAGSRAVVNRLCEAVFTYAVRTHLSTVQLGGNGLNALRDPRIGDAISAIRSSPERHWTVKSLATRVGMSRSSFAAQFRTVVGEPPLKHLIRCRVEKACQLLADDGVSLADVANRVGYESDAAFSKVFKRCTGITPGSYRTRSIGHA